MGMQLSEKYRPKTFEDFRGSDLVAKMLQRMVETESIPNCLLFSGPKGCGKTSMARILNLSLNKEEASSLSFIEVDAASNNGVDHVRSLQETIRYSHPGSWRVVVLDEAHNLSTPAFNALLKVLEDPPNKTVFILITTKPETIPDTVKSRAMPFRFQRASENIIARRLAEVVVAEKLPITDPKVLLRMAKVSDGSLRTAMILLQQALLVEDLTEEAINFLSGYMVDTKDLMYAMLSGNLHEVEMELSNVFSESNDVEKMIISFSQTLKEFHAASLINNAQYLSSQTVIWNMRKILRGNDTVARTQLEAGLFALFAQNFWNGEEGSVEAPSNALTPEDISQLS